MTFKRWAWVGFVAIVFFTHLLIGTLLAIATAFYWRMRPQQPESIIRLPQQFSIPEAVHTILERMPDNGWVKHLLSEGGLADYEKRLSNTIERVFAETTGDLKNKLTLFSGIGVMVIINSWEYSASLKHLQKAVKVLSKERTLYLLQTLYEHRHFFNNDPYTLDMEHIREKFLTPTAKLIADTKEVLGDAYTWEEVFISSITDLESARFRLEAAIWMAAVGVPSMTLGYPPKVPFSELCKMAEAGADRWLNTNIGGK